MVIFNIVGLMFLTMEKVHKMSVLENTNIPIQLR